MQTARQAAGLKRQMLPAEPTRAGSTDSADAGCHARSAPRMACAIWLCPGRCADLRLGRAARASDDVRAGLAVFLLPSSPSCGSIIRTRSARERARRSRSSAGPATRAAWGRLCARADERGLELRSRSAVFGWAVAGWRTLIPWRDLRAVRETHRGRQVLSLSAVGCSGGALWVDDESAHCALVQHAGDWRHAPAVRRELEQGVQTEWRAGTAVVLAAVAAFVAWFGAASAGVMTEWPRSGCSRATTSRSPAGWSRTGPATPTSPTSTELCGHRRGDELCGQGATGW